MGFVVGHLHPSRWDQSILLEHDAASLCNGLCCWTSPPFKMRPILLEHDAASMCNGLCCWTSPPFKMRPLHCLETSGTDFTGSSFTPQKKGVPIYIVPKNSLLITSSFSQLVAWILRAYETCSLLECDAVYSVLSVDQTSLNVSLFRRSNFCNKMSMYFYQTARYHVPYDGTTNSFFDEMVSVLAF